VCHGKLQQVHVIGWVSCDAGGAWLSRVSTPVTPMDGEIVDYARSPKEIDPVA
jgi:hypothetical protein